MKLRLGGKVKGTIITDRKSKGERNFGRFVQMQTRQLWVHLNSRTNG